ncbi:MAG: hypothetical protein JWM11_3603, partial [Planctomycetaceae bacterium]|nr:hypothetical protein [Planctomycetaceae bacterium]
LAYDALTGFEELEGDRVLVDYFWNQLLVESSFERRIKTASRMWQLRQSRETATAIAKGLGFDKPIVSLDPYIATRGQNLWDLFVMLEEDAEVMRPGLESLKNHPAVRVRSEVHRVLQGLKPK